MSQSDNARPARSPGSGKVGPDASLYFSPATMAGFCLSFSDGDPTGLELAIRESEAAAGPAVIATQEPVEEGRPIKLFVLGDRILTEIIYFPTLGSGYGNFGLADVLLLVWDKDKPVATIYCLSGESFGGRMDWLWHERLLAGGMSIPAPFNNRLLATNSVSSPASGGLHD
jgi:hypothetical protein